MSTWKHAKRWHLWTEHGFGVEVCQHSEKTEEERGFYDFPCAWNTYLFFSDKLHFSRDGKLCEPYVEPDLFTSYLWEHRDALNCLEGWNGSPTFHEFVTNERGQRRIKIGDDFMHFWDRENRHFELYDLGYMQRRVMRTAAEAAELLRLVRRMEGG